MTDRTCAECERLWRIYENAIQSHLLIEHNSALESGLEVLKRKASNRCEEARKAVEDHQATHIETTAVARAAS